MANRTAHVVGGGLGTFRKQAQKAHEAREQARRKEEQKAAIAAIIKAK